jgi:hypothetical protein
MVTPGHGDPRGRGLMASIVDCGAVAAIWILWK